MQPPLRTLLLLGFTFLAAPAARSQQAPEAAPPGGFVLHMAGPDSTLGTFRFDPNEEVRVIVLFKAPPLSVVEASGSSKAGLAAAQSAIAAEHQQFLNDLARLEGASSGKAQPSTRVGAAFTVALNGMALTARRALLGEISRLDYVSRVEPDRQVRAAISALRDEPSNRVTGVDQVRARFGLTGKDVTIAILDTGIDYLHPDLGGGLGAGFKVVGGYDFINDDADPMDDNGHGTHVAGIAAGSGAAHPGVAPGAKLYAYKVLDAQGMGMDSHIIAAIERAMDPNGDGSFDDAVDILNASLSSPGDADDAKSVAMDNATAAGVLCVVAAGNDSHYQSIGSPGSSRRALTAGASDNSDAIASFSSRGPSAVALAMKPDVVAPGVAITAAWPGGGYETLNGTSMAAPHVSGAAALLLERRPDWSPEVLKAVFMGTAKDISTDQYTQGAGRVDVLAAAQAQTAVLPGSISLGQVDAAVPVWAGQAVLELANLGATEQSYALTVAEPLPAGITVTLTPAAVAVPAGETVQVTVNVAVTNALAPYRDAVPPTYAWHIRAKSATSEVRVPLNLIKSSSVKVDLADPLGHGSLTVIGLDKRYAQGFFPFVSGNTLLLPEGTYTFQAPTSRMEGGRALPVFRVVEGIRVSGSATVAFEPAEAAHRVHLQPRDETGQPIPADFVGYSLTVPGFAGPFTSSGSLWSDRVYASSLQPGITLDVLAYSLRTGPEKQYMSTYRIGTGLSGSISLENDPAQYRQVAYRYAAPPDADHVWVVPGYYRQVGSPNSIMTLSSEFGDPRAPGAPADLPADHFRLSAPFERTVYLTPTPVAASPFRGVIDRVYPRMDAVVPPLYETPPVRAEADRMVVFRNKGGAFGGAQQIVPGARIEFNVGVAPPYWSARAMRFNNTLIGLDHETDVLYTNGRYDRPGGTVQLELYEAGVLKSHHEADNLFPVVFLDAGSDALLRARMNGYFVAEKSGTATTDLRFDVVPADRNPPYITDFQIRAGDVAANRLEPGQANTVRFALSTDPAIKKAQLAYRRSGTASWIPLAAFASAGPHETALPDTLPPGYYDLQLFAEDRAAGQFEPGNWTAYRAEPAFVFRHRPMGENAAPAAVRLQHPADGSMIDFAASPVLPLAWTASADADAGDRLSYTIRFWGRGLDTTLTVWSAPRLDLALPPVLYAGATYLWTVTTADGFSEVASPDTFGVRFANATAAEDDLVPAAFALRPAFPNPSSGTLTLPFDLATAAEAVIEVYDLLGQRVAVLASGAKPAGAHRVEWEAGGLASGVYFCRMKAAGHVFTQKLVLVR